MAVVDFPTADDSLAIWLDWMTHWHPVGIDLGLTRSEAVYKKMAFSQAGIPTIVVGGTNGKGSVTAFLGSILEQSGYKTGVYRSPHLLRYNERVRVNNLDASDDAIIAGFVKTLTACKDDSLSYFEFSTIAALQTFVDQKIDIAILEVGLGGRLDVVNIVDPIVSIVTNVGIDHVDWLGDDREVIGWEKAHIFRSNRLAICGDANPPNKLVDYAAEIKANLVLREKDFTISEDPANDDTLNYKDLHNASCNIAEIPTPKLPGVYQQSNLASALAAIGELKRHGFNCADAHVRSATATAFLPGRLQHIADELCDWLLDVGHNADAAFALSSYLKSYKQQNPKTPIYAIFGVMKDKDIHSIVQSLKHDINHWHLTAPDIDRAIDVEDLIEIVKEYVPAENISHQQNIKESIEFVKANIIDNVKIEPGEPQPNCSFKPLVVIFGSFYTVGEAFSALQN